MLDITPEENIYFWSLAQGIVEEAFDQGKLVIIEDGKRYKVDSLQFSQSGEIALRRAREALAEKEPDASASADGEAVRP